MLFSKLPHLYQQKAIQNCLTFLIFFLKAPKTEDSKVPWHSYRNILAELNTPSSKAFLQIKGKHPTHVFVHHEAEEMPGSQWMELYSWPLILPLARFLPVRTMTEIFWSVEFCNQCLSYGRSLDQTNLRPSTGFHWEPLAMRTHREKAPFRNENTIYFYIENTTRARREGRLQ